MSPNKGKVKAELLKRHIIYVLRRAHMLKVHIFQVTMIKKQVKELRDSEELRSVAHFQYYNTQTYHELRSIYVPVCWSKIRTGCKNGQLYMYTRVNKNPSA